MPYITDSELNVIEFAPEPNFVSFPLDDSGGLIQGPGGAISKTGDNKSANYEAGSQGWIIRSNGDVEFNSGTFRGALIAGSIDIPDTTTAASFHVDSTGQMWVGATTYASAPFKVSAAGVLTATSGTVGGWTMAATTLTGGGVTLSNTGYVKAAKDANNYVEMLTASDDAYLHGVVGGDNAFYFGYVDGGTFNNVNNLRISQTISTPTETYPYWAFDPGGVSATSYLRLIKYNSAGVQAEWNFDNTGGASTVSDFWCDRIGGLTDTTIDFQNSGYATIDNDIRPTANDSLALGYFTSAGSASNRSWAQTVTEKIVSKNEYVLDLSGDSETGMILTNQHFGTTTTSDLGDDVDRYWDDIYCDRVYGQTSGNYIDFTNTGSVISGSGSTSTIKTNSDFTFCNITSESYTPANGTVHWNSATGTLRLHTGGGTWVTISTE